MISPALPGIKLRILLLPACLYANWAVGADWTTSAGIAPGLIFTDNYCLEKDNERDEIIATVTPSLGLEGAGSRANLSFIGEFEFNNQDDEIDECRNNNGSTEAFNPRVSALADATLIDQWLFIDASATADQNSVDSFRGGGGDGINGRGNTNTTYTVAVSPYVERRLKRAADLSARLGYEQQYNTEDIVSDEEDGTRRFADLSLASQPGSTRLDWEIAGEYDEVDYDESDELLFREDESQLASAEVTIGYSLHRKWRIFASAGDEWNDFATGVQDDDIDGTFWTAGFNYTPSPRTSLSIATGDRFFGVTPSVDFSHRRRRSLFTLNYAKQLTYTRSLRNGSDLFGVQESFIDEVALDPEAELLVSETPTTRSRSPIVDERGTLSYDYTGKRSNFGVSASYSEQNRLDTREESTFISVGTTLTRQLSRYSDASFSLTWSDVESDEETGGIFEGDSQSWSFSAGLDRSLTESLTTTLRYQYTDRDSDVEFDSYTENRLILNLQYAF